MEDQADELEPASESAHAVLFERDTKGVLVAGRLAGTGDLTRAQLGEFSKQIEALGAKHGLQLVVVPSGDMTDTGPEPDSECFSCVAVGLVIAAGGTDGPEAFSLDEAQRTLEAARQAPQGAWDEIAALYSKSERADFLKGQPQLYLMPVGPLAAAYVAFGAEGDAESAGFGELVRGQDMSQHPHAVGVWGQKVAGCSAEGSGSAVVDLSEAAHQARASAVPNGRYFLIGRYD